MSQEKVHRNTNANINRQENVLVRKQHWIFKK